MKRAKKSERKDCIKNRLYAKILVNFGICFVIEFTIIASSFFLLWVSALVGRKNRAPSRDIELNGIESTAFFLF